MPSKNGKTCASCNLEVAAVYFTYNKYWCNKCIKTYNKKWQQDNKEKVYLDNLSKRLRNYEFIYQYLSNHPCVDCGESDIVVLDFDHLRDKRMGVSALMHRGASIASLEKEISKCEVVCANCHRRRTAKTGNWYKLKVS